MSNKYIDMAWNYTAKNSGQKLVLLSLADHADKNGVCFPGIDRLSAKTGLSKRMVQYHLEALKSDGAIKIEYNSGTKTISGYTNKYQIVRGEVHCTPSPNGVQPIAPDGVKCIAPDGVQPIAPKPSVKPSVKPTTRGNGKTLPPKTDEKLKPKTILSDCFIKASGIKMPTRKTDLGFWWSSINEIFNMANKDVEVGTALIEFTVKKMRREQLTMSNPNSIINPARDVMARRSAQKKDNQAPKVGKLVAVEGWTL